MLAKGAGGVGGERGGERVDTINWVLHFQQCPLGCCMRNGLKEGVTEQ